jgi:hypothetical protein
VLRVEARARRAGQGGVGREGEAGGSDRGADPSTTEPPKPPGTTQCGKGQ